MYVALVPNRNSPPAYLLREGYREDGKVKSRTLANLSHWPLAKIERLRRVLRDEVLGGTAEGLTRCCAACRTDTSPRCWASLARSASIACWPPVRPPPAWPPWSWR